MPKAVYDAYGYVKKAAAMVNKAAGKLAQEKADLIIKVADEVIAGKLDEEFPLFVWQTGSGTQSNMNVNEVIANRAIQLAGGKLGTKTPIHPNDDVNMGQSLNDTFCTAMHIATVKAVTEKLLPRAEKLADAMLKQAKLWVDVVKIGRTHLQDATPLTVGQAWSGYVTQIRDAIEVIKTALNPVIGYDKASLIAHKAFDENKMFREAAIESGFISAADFDKIVVPANMVGNPRRDLDNL